MGLPSSLPRWPFHSTPGWRCRASRIFSPFCSIALFLLPLDGSDLVWSEGVGSSRKAACSDLGLALSLSLPLLRLLCAVDRLVLSNVRGETRERAHLANSKIRDTRDSSRSQVGRRSVAGPDFRNFRPASSRSTRSRPCDRVEPRTVRETAARSPSWPRRAILRAREGIATRRNPRLVPSLP